MSRSRTLAAAFLLAATQPLVAWNDTGHRVVAAIAWERLTASTKDTVIALLRAAPADACLTNLFPTDSRPLDVRQRAFFIAASTWPDIVRPGDNDQRPCTRFHRRDWHFVNFFWQGTSGAGGSERPTDRDQPRTSELNLFERLTILRPAVACGTAACGTTTAERAMLLAWILHLVGDVHQPLHASARVTSRERDGDQGGNLFTILRHGQPTSLHSYWDGIVNEVSPRKPGESDEGYVSRLQQGFVVRHPFQKFESRLQTGAFEAWSRETLQIAKSLGYPSTLRRDREVPTAYRTAAFQSAEAAIALAGYRLADLLNAMFGS